MQFRAEGKVSKPSANSRGEKTAKNGTLAEPLSCGWQSKRVFLLESEKAT
jgi:hypothetical protein